MTAEIIPIMDDMVDTGQITDEMLMRYLPARDTVYQVKKDLDRLCFDVEQGLPVDNLEYSANIASASASNLMLVWILRESGEDVLALQVIEIQKTEKKARKFWAQVERWVMEGKE